MSKGQLKRQSSKFAERLELELLVAGTEFSDLERTVFKVTRTLVRTLVPDRTDVSFCCRLPRPTQRCRKKSMCKRSFNTSIEAYQRNKRSKS